MNPNLIIKELQNNFPHLFGGSEQSEDAYATIVRYCREQGGYKQKLVAKEAAQKTIEKTKKTFKLSEDRYAELSDDWQEIREAATKTKILVSLDKKSKLAATAFAKTFKELKAKKDEMAAKRKAFYIKCSAKIKEQKVLIENTNAQLQAIADCIEKVRQGLTVADYGLKSLGSTERSFELGISRTLNKQTSSFNTLACTLAFEQDETGKWQYTNFRTVVNETLFETTKLTVHSKIQNEETGSFLLTVNGDLKLSLLDIKKGEASRKVDQSSSSSRTKRDTTNSTSSSSDTIDQDENAFKTQSSSGFEDYTNVANQTFNRNVKDKADLTDHTARTKEWEEEVTSKTEEYYKETTQLVETIHKLSTLTQKYDRMTVTSEQDSKEKGNLYTDIYKTVEEIVGYLNSLPFIRKIPYVGPIVNTLSIAFKTIDRFKKLWNFLFEDKEPKDIIEKVNSNLEQRIKTDLRKEAEEVVESHKTITSETHTDGKETEDTRRDASYQASSDVNENSNQTEWESKNYGDQEEETAVKTFDYERNRNAQSSTTRNVDENASNESKLRDNSREINTNEEDIEITGQFSLVLICETNEDGSLLVRRDSSTELGPIEKSIQPKLKHDDQLEISFELKTDKLYN